LVCPLRYVVDGEEGQARMSERPDIEAARAKMSVSLGSGKEIKRLPEYLWEGETVQMMVTGAYGKGVGLLVYTDRRLLFVQHGIMSQTSEDFPLDKLSSVQWSAGMVQGTITIFASGAKAEVKNVNKIDGKAIVDAVRGRLQGNGAASPSQTVPVVAPPSDAPAADPMDQLRKLGELRDAGILSEAEFAAKKAEILARI
jgi:hypothetical protein